MLPTREEALDLYPSVWRRCFAALLDATVFYVPFFVLWYVLSTFWHALTYVTASGYLGYLSLLLLWPYCALWESSRFQATPGKLALGMRVTDIEGSRIDFARATARYFSKLATTATLFIGYLILDVTSHKQALHDLLAKTCVVNTAVFRAWQDAGSPSYPQPTAAAHRSRARAWIGLGFSVLVIASIAYCSNHLISRSNALSGFCTTVKPGDSREQLESAVAARGYRIAYGHDPQGDFAQIYDPESLYRNVCTVGFKDGGVQDAKYHPFD